MGDREEKGRVEVRGKVGGRTTRCNIYSVEPLLKNTPKVRTPGKALVSGIKFTRKLVRTPQSYQVPKVSTLEGFHCISSLVSRPSARPHRKLGKFSVHVGSCGGSGNETTVLIQFL